MKAKMLMIFVLIICVAPLHHAFSADQIIEGEITATGKYIGVEGGEGGKAKFTEYRDLKEHGGLYARGRFSLDSPDYFLRFDMQDPGYDDQYYDLQGGMYGKFNLDLFYNEIPHNITFGARTFFLGAGHDVLIGAPNMNVGSWNTFDYSTERRKYGGSLKYDMLKPFFFDVSYSREQKEGIKPAGIVGIDSPGDAALELPEPVDFVTNNLNLAAGYAKNPLFLSFNYFYSQFNNSNTNLNFINPFTATPDVLTLPPDNKYYKLAFKGGVKLPFNSRFNMNIGYGRGDSGHSFFPTFDGNVKTNNYDFVLASNPIRFIDFKLYYKYYKRDNKSDDPSQTVVEFLDYKIDTYGAELGFRLPARFYLTGGYKYVKTKRHEFDDPEEVLPFNKDNSYFVNLKWSGVDFMSLRLGYERLDRDADYQSVETAAQPARRFAYAAQNRDTYKATVDIFPLDNLNVGFMYQWRKVDYNDTIFGLKSDKRDELEVSADYLVGKIVKLYGFSDFGLIRFNQSQSTSDLPWNAKQKERNFGYGIGAEVYVIPKKLTFVFQQDYMKSNGNVDFTINQGLFAGVGLDPAVTGANNSNVDITRWDDYIRWGLKFKAIYDLTKSMKVFAGYAYERYKYRDAQLDNYQFINPPGGPVDGNSGAFLTGAFKDQSYRANIIFGGATYKF